MNIKMRKFLFLTLALMLCYLAGCSNPEERGYYLYNNKKIPMPNLAIYANHVVEYTSFCYVIDTETKVVYILYNANRVGSLCPCLKADGTPMLASDLGLE